MGVNNGKTNNSSNIPNINNTALVEIEKLLAVFSLN